MIGVGLNITIFDFPEQMPNWMLFYPALNICRIFYILTYNCGYIHCLSIWSMVTPELKNCLIILYASGFVYILAGMYLYEIVPQTYGVRRNPLFFLKFFIFCRRKYNTAVVPFGKLFNNKYILLDEEDDEEEDQIEQVKAQKEKIKSIIFQIENDLESESENKNTANYPLIVYELSKIYKGSNLSKKEKKLRKKALHRFSLMLEKNEIFGLLG